VKSETGDGTANERKSGEEELLEKRGKKGRGSRNMLEFHRGIRVAGEGVDSG